MHNGKNMIVAIIMPVTFKFIYYVYLWQHTSCLHSLCFHFTIQETEANSPCKAANQPLLCSGWVVRHLHHQHCLNWYTSALWSGLCTHALLLPGCVLLDGSRSHPLTQDTCHCFQTRYHKLCCHCHGNMLGYAQYSFLLLNDAIA